MLIVFAFNEVGKKYCLYLELDTVMLSIIQNTNNVYISAGTGLSSRFSLMITAAPINVIDTLGHHAAFLLKVVKMHDTCTDALIFRTSIVGNRNQLYTHFQKLCFSCF